MASSDRLSIFRSRQYAPSTNPPAGSNFLYPKADGLWYSRDSAGVETQLGGSGGSATTDASLLTQGTLADARLTQRLRGGGTAITDFDATVAAGWYSATSATAHPPFASSWNLMVIPNTATGFVTQIAYELQATPGNNAPTIWTRQSNGAGTWAAWRRMDPEFLTNATNLSTGTLPDGRLSTRLQTRTAALGTVTDFNTLLDSGWYYVNTNPANGTVAANGPTYASTYVTQVIASASSSTTVQIIYETNGADYVFLRVQRGSTWYNWRRIDPEYLRDRANHTGTQAASTITGLTAATIGLGNVDNTSDVNKPISTAVQTALTGKAASGLPTYAGNRTNPFSPATSWYNLTPATQHIIRATMAKADVARVRITAMGHSMLAGAFASQVGSTDTVATLRRYLGGLGANIGGTGVVKIANNTTLDYRWVLTGTWSRPNGSAPNDTADPFASTTSSFAVATFTSDMPGTVVDVHTFDNTAPMAIYVDDVLMETYAPAGTGANVTRTYTGLANTKHVVKIAPTTAGTTYLVGVNVRKTVGIEVSNMGQAGSSAADWAAGVNYINRQVAMADAPPAIAILQLDTNEVLWGGPTPIATYKTNYGSLIAAIQATGAAVIMVASPPATGGNGANGYPAVSQATWESYVAAEYDLADQYNVALLDLNHLFISQATASSDGLWGDPIHLNDYGYGLVARSLGTSAVWGQSNAALDQQISLTAEYTSNQPATPATGVTLFSRFRGRRMPAFVGPTGQDTHLQPALFSNMTGWVKAIAAVTTPTVDGLAVTHLNNATATPTAVPLVGGASLFASLAKYRCATTTTAGTGGGTRTNTAQWQFTSTANLGGFFYVARFGFNTLSAGSRAFVGLAGTAAVLSPTVDPSTILNTMGFGFDAADTNLQFIRNDASGTATKTDLGANFPKLAGAARDFYEVRLFAPSGAGAQVYWCAIRLNDNYVVQGGPITTKIPAVSTMLAAHLHVSNGATAAAHSIDIQSLYIETDN